MKNILFVICLFFCYNLTFSQDSWIITNTKNDAEESKIKEVIPIVNETTGNLALLFKTKDGFLSYLYNNKQELLKTITIDKLPAKAKNLIGQLHQDNTFTLFFANNSNTHFCCLKVNFDSETIEKIDDLQLNPKKEKVIKYINNENKLFLLSIVKNESILKLHTFNLDGTTASNTFDFSNEVFENDNGLEYSLYTILFSNSFTASFDAVENNIPISLETTSAYNKLYYSNGKISLINNFFNKHTYKLDIDIKKNKATTSKIINKNFLKENHNANANSFLFEDYFFNVYTTNEQLNLDIHNSNTNEIIKGFTILKEEPISFKNTPIIQEGGDFDTYRELEKTSKFLRKITNSKLGVAVYKEGENYVLTLGASEQVKSGNFVIIGGLLGGAIGAVIFSTFDSYTKTKSTRIVCLLDSNFNPVSGEVPLNGFDKIQNFLVENKLEHLKLQTVFKYKDSYIWGSYNFTAGFYRLHQFKNN